jgi:Protein of unknown function (DUF3800)
MELPEYKYVAYIDEAGDPGLKAVMPRTPGGSSEWFVLAAALIPAEDEANTSAWANEMLSGLRSHQLKLIHFTKLNDSQKAFVCSYIAQKNVRIFIIACNKQNMQGYENPFAAKISGESIGKDNWFYCWVSRLLLERITDYVRHKSHKRYGVVKKVKLEFSARGGLSYAQMHAYYEWIKIKSANGTVPLHLPWGDIAFETLDKYLFFSHNHTERSGLILADIAASAFFKAIDIHNTNKCDPSFARLLGPKLAISPDTKQVGGYGLKLFKNWTVLNEYKVQEIQKTIFREFGYPSNYWWRG